MAVAPLGASIKSRFLQPDTLEGARMTLGRSRTSASASGGAAALCTALGLVCLLFGLQAAAETTTGSSYRVPWSTLDAGGGRVQSASGLRMDGTLGQSEPELVPLCSADGGAACVGARYALRGGFWPGFLPTAPGAGCGGAPECLFRDGFESPAPPGGGIAPVPNP